MCYVTFYPIINLIEIIDTKYVFIQVFFFISTHLEEDYESLAFWSYISDKNGGS